MNKNYDCYFNGKFCNYESIQVGLLSNSLNYGTSVIESIRFYKTDQGCISLNIDDYLDRFFSGLEEYGFEIEETSKKIKKIFSYLIKLNPHIQSPYIRVICYIGDESANTMSNDIYFGVILMDLDNSFFPDVSATFSRFLRLNHNSNTMKLACNYAKNILEQRYVQKRGKDVVIFLGEKKEILECLSENLFYCKNNAIYTSHTGNIVNGINRRLVMLIAKHLAIPYYEEDITQKDILAADEIFITGTATGIRNIINIDDYNIGKIGFTDKIHQVYADVFSGKIKFPEIKIEDINTFS